MERVKHFTELLVWKSGHKLVLMTYEMTRGFPKDERFGMIDQMRRAAVSITSNIAEGFGRSHRQEKHQFYAISRGSLLELRNQFIIARDLGYITEMQFREIEQVAEETAKLLSGFIGAMYRNNGSEK